MSSGHLTRETLEQLARRELNPRELIDALRHVDGCAECTARAAQLARADADALHAIATSAVPDHLDFDTQLLPFVEHRLGRADLEIVSSHLEDCPMCRAEADDLRALHERTTHPPRARWGTLAAAAAAAMVVLLAIVTVQERPSSQRPAPRRVAAPPAPAGSEAKTYAKPEWERLVTTAVAMHALPFPRDLADLAPPRDELRGASGESPQGPLSPAGVVVRETRPRFSWPARGNATYVVSIFTVDEEVAHSGTLRAAHWSPSRDLQRGLTYVWQVQVTSAQTTDTIPAPPAPPAMFRIAGAAGEQDLRDATAAHPDDHFLHAVLLARAGLRDDAARALALARSSGDDRAAAIP